MRVMRKVRPRLLDLFCCQGGSSVGYARAGFEVVGVDIEPQPHYPFEFVQADAMNFDLSGFDAVHASPPCQRFSRMTKRWGTEEDHPDLISATRRRLIEAGIPYVIENVMGAPLLDPVKLCGSHFGLRVRRHRLFESNFEIEQPDCDHASQGRVVGVYGNPGGSSTRDGVEFGGADDWRKAMDMPWATIPGLREAIPPAYTTYIGNFLWRAVRYGSNGHRKKRVMHKVRSG